jgi:hypothetical protein
LQTPAPSKQASLTRHIAPFQWHPHCTQQRADTQMHWILGLYIKCCVFLLVFCVVSYFLKNI